MHSQNSFIFASARGGSLGTRLYNVPGSSKLKLYGIMIRIGFLVVNTIHDMLQLLL